MTVLSNFHFVDELSFLQTSPWTHTKYFMQSKIDLIVSETLCTLLFIREILIKFSG